jgi:hypothetical protein
VINMIRCKKGCINGIVWKQIALGDFISHRCDCMIKKEIEAYDNWFGIIRKA